jgi:hypothetical protein
MKRISECQKMGCQIRVFGLTRDYHVGVFFKLSFKGLTCLPNVSGETIVALGLANTTLLVEGGLFIVIEN